MKTNKLLLLLFFFPLLIHAQNDKRLQTNGTIYMDLNLVTSGPDYIDVPVTFTSTDSIVALDFALQYTESVLSYNAISSTAPYLTDALAKYSLDDKTLRFTSNSSQYYKVNQKILTIRFNLLTGHVSKTNIFSLVGYLNGDRVNMEVRGDFPFHTGSLKFWLDNSPIVYNANDPDNYLITNIYGVNPSCSNKSTAIQPDSSGQFKYTNASGPFLQIERDILASTNVQPVINVLDVNLANKILVNDVSFIPTIYQVIALDVNADGVISAGDVSQINQRSVKTITEFKQKWNYNNNGTSNGQPSKDWLFVDSTILASPPYQLSTTYPLNDQIGYSKAKVPIVHFCLPAPSLNSHTSYTGMLLGDVNGNYASISNDGKIKRQAFVKKNK